MSRLAFSVVVLLGACASREPTGLSLSPQRSATPPDPSVNAVTPPASSSARAVDDPLDTPPRSSGPLHLAASGPGPHLSWVMSVEGGPVLVTGNKDKLYVWDDANRAFVERPDLLNGMNLDNGGEMIGRITGDLWFARRTPDQKTELFRRPSGKTWQHIAMLDGDAAIEPFSANAILAKVSAHNGATHFEVFGDPPLPAAPKTPPAKGPCSVDLQNGGFAALADGSVVAGSECYAVWSKSSGNAAVKRAFNGAVVAIERESETSAIVFGERPDNTPIIVRGNGVEWAAVDTTKLGKMRVRNVGRTSDGTEWIIGEREGDEPRLFRLAPKATEWERMPIAMGTSDPKEDEHTSVSMLTIVDGEVWVRAEHTVKIEGPYTYAIYTTRPTKHVLTTP